MKLEATRYMRKPFFVTGHQVTTENMRAVAEWCGGEICTIGDRVFIRVPILNVKNIKQTEANLGDHILKMEFGGRFNFKIERDEWLTDRFVQVEILLSLDDDLEIEEPPVVNNVAFLPAQSTRPRNIRVL